MSRSDITRTIGGPASHARSTVWTLARVERAWKFAVEVMRESRAMEKHAWYSSRLPYNGW